MKCLVDNETKCFCEGVQKSVYDTDVIPLLNAIGTFIIDSQDKFDAWVSNTSGNDYTHIVIIGGNGSWTNGEYESHTEINLTTIGTKTIQGVKDAKIINYSSIGIKYNTCPTDNDYWIRDLYVSSGTYGFYNCTNLTNCYGCGIYGFYNCTNLTNCKGFGNDGDDFHDGSGYGFYNCINLTNCYGLGFSGSFGISGNGSGYGFYNCNVVSHCKGYTDGDLACTTSVFNNSYASWSNNATYVCGDTANGGFNKTT